MDVIFYFVVSMLIATILCYLIFLVKDNFQSNDIRKEIQALNNVGTAAQKQQEQTVIGYQKKIADFTSLFKNHEFASNVFAFMQAQTMPNIWFKQFSLDEKGGTVQLAGESDNMDAFSRQVATFEKNKYVQSVGSLNSSLGDSARIQFNMSLALNQSIFGYISNPASIAQVVSPSEQPVIDQSQAAIPASLPEEAVQQSSAAPNTQGLITSFHLLLNPVIIGTVDETNFTVALEVPFGTDVKNLPTAIVASTGATVSPSSNTSQDFTSPVTYTVTAQDGTTQAYLVKVTAASPPKIAVKANQSGIGGTLLIIFAIIIIIATGGTVIFVRRRMQNQKAKF
jgi:hypothetical protein